jgi:hypothetical protein
MQHEFRIEADTYFHIGLAGLYFSRFIITNRVLKTKGSILFVGEEMEWK